MFTGIIQEVGRLKAISTYPEAKISVHSQKLFSMVEIGESISVNGVCLSLVKKEKNLLFFHLSQETLKKTNLSSLKPESHVNRSRSLTLSSPLGGHLILGHVDGISKILSIKNMGSSKRVKFSLPQELKKFAVKKGSIAVNGISLTIAEIGNNFFEVELIPITLENTNLKYIKIGDLVNLEMDIIGKYVEKFMKERNK